MTATSERDCAIETHTRERVVGNKSKIGIGKMRIIEWVLISNEIIIAWI